MPSKLSPISYAIASFLLVPCAVVLVLGVALVLVVLALGYWLVIPFAVYATMKPERKSYGKLDLSEQEPAAPQT